MKKTTLILLLIAMLVLAAPVSAHGKQRVGERIGVFYDGAQTFPAGEPFHIVHGFVIAPNDGPPGRYLFQLEVDGVLQEGFLETAVDRSVLPEFLSRVYVYNFPQGMNGVHTFTGHWLQPCSSVSDSCAKPNQLIETRTTVVEVSFE